MSTSWFDEILIQAASGKGPWKLPVRVVATSNITLSGLQVVDGVSLSEGDPVLCVGQTSAAQNWIHTASSGTWTRRADSDTADKVFCGVSVYVREGATYQKTAWRLTTTGSIVLGTTALAAEELPSVRDKFRLVRRAQLTTTDGTPTTVTAAAISMADSTTLEVELRAKADASNDPNSASFRRVYTYKRAGGAPALVGTVTDVHIRKDDASWNAELIASGNDLLARVTGANGQTVAWDVVLEAF